MALAAAGILLQALFEMRIGTAMDFDALYSESRLLFSVL
jgi:hypothetical protein